jgi:PHD/YefM family antitoxin component YafN of YafNO toxin-antitoxin module
VIKNNQLDAVLFSVKEYQRLSGVLEYLGSLDEKDIAKVMDALPKPGVRNNYPMENL